MLRQFSIFLKYPHVQHHRLLFLGDTMGVVLSCARSRSRSSKFILQLRKLCSLCLIMNVKVHFRWIPAELNSSDLASRTFEEGPLKHYILQCLTSSTIYVTASNQFFRVLFQMCTTNTMLPQFLDQLVVFCRSRVCHDTIFGRG